jgi:hypothetical protein
LRNSPIPGTGHCALFLQALQLFERFVESALKADFVAGHLAVGVGVECVVRERMDKVRVAAEMGVVVFPRPGDVVELFGEEAGLHLANAFEPPAGDDDVFDQGLLDRAGWLAFVLDGLAELLEIGRIFDGGQNDFGGGEAVRESVEADGVASFRSFRAAALASVAAVGCYLTFSGHGNLMVLAESGFARGRAGKWLERWGLVGGDDCECAMADVIGSWLTGAGVSRHDGSKRPVNG